MQIEVHNKQGKVICVLDVDEERTHLHNAEEWAWDTAQHIAEESKQRGEFLGLQLGAAARKTLDEQKKRHRWWQRLRQRANGQRCHVAIPRSLFDNYQCPTCERNTIQPVSAVGPVMAIGFSPGHRVAGYACQNPDCQAHDVAIPSILVTKIYEKP